MQISRKDRRMLQNKAKSKLFKGPQIAPGVYPGVKWEDLEPISCKCGGDVFLIASRLALASHLQATSGQQTIVQHVVGYACVVCHQINNYTNEKLQGPPKPPTSEEPSENVKK